ncbi:hypothetical protein I79_012980 [Cricetulus griseus]|uniref:Uncharacterized protein n=1 Tax=Cricetulus griseus TaxID=10029 RepID=G3HQ85_CRIGR|nr:hypothetical protein I79_012980 [Cricetulus griseus]
MPAASLPPACGILLPVRTWARCSRFSSSCLACLRAAFCTLRVSLALSSSSV